MIPAIAFPVIDPVAFSIGPVVIRWYALAYIAGILLGWKYVVRLVTTDRLWRGTPPMTRDHVDDFVIWATLGIILGGRVGYVLFYNFDYYSQNLAEIPMVWRGGMAFHGGLLGVLIAIGLFARKHTIPVWSLGDVVCAAVPIGLFFGRVANFINAELWGRASDVPWAMVFPGTDGIPRHPSQLYQAALEGLLLFLILRIATHQFDALKRPGVVTGLFLAGYGLFRAFVEVFREPDAHIGFLAGGLTMGILLSVPMMAAGIAIVIWSARRSSPA